jgi:hypothetical protein
MVKVRGINSPETPSFFWEFGVSLRGPGGCLAALFDHALRGCVEISWKMGLERGAAPLKLSPPKA